MTKNNNDILKKAVKTVTVSTLALAVAITIDKTAEVEAFSQLCCRKTENQRNHQIRYH